MVMYTNLAESPMGDGSDADACNAADNERGLGGRSSDDDV